MDPYAYLQQAAGRFDHIDDPGELDRILDDIEYLYEVMDPELQSLAEDLMNRVRSRLALLRQG